MKKRIINSIYICLTIMVSTMLYSCNEEFSKLIPDSEETDIDVIYGTPKVLLIVADGARGESVKNANIPVMNGLLPNAIHSWVSLGEENALNIASNWTNLFTGVNYLKHGVRDADFSTNKLGTFPLVFKRIKNVTDTINMELVSSNDNFLEYFGEDTQSVKSQNDDDTKAKMIASLANNDLSFLTGHFTAIDAAGAQSGYDLSYPAYKASIEKFDTQVGEIIDALKARPNYSKENWLVIITSSQGGNFEIPDNLNDNTVFSNPLVNTFTIMYSPSFETKFIGKPYIGNKYIGNFMLFKGDNYAELDSGDNDLFNLGLGDFTIEMKIKKNKGSNNNYSFSYPSLLGKRKHWQGSWDRETDGIGWVIHLSGESWIFNARGDKGTGEIKADKNMNRGTWNTITVASSTVNGERKVRLYTNGEQNKEATITGWGAINSAAKLRLGKLPTRENWNSDAYISDIKIWKADLGSGVIKQYSCDIGIDPNHPFRANLAAYWPVSGTDGETILDESPFANHLTTGSNNYPVIQLNDFLCAPSVETLGAQVPRTIDVATQIISWLKIPRQTGWQLDGRVWIDK